MGLEYGLPEHMLKPEGTLVLLCNFYRPQTKLRKGNVVTSVCQEFCPGGGCLEGDVHGRGDGGACMAGETATAADGTHPAGMHSCLKGILVH